ncbi:DUF397 domain-containing protein [Nocardiopsis sp. NPDC049922]|uniref:DUF397 domain-containing protein n=1 Tax=Nocardiopsis sp. NPDC049922 TaxID=3155157 RepID=UPI003400969F
MPYVQILTIGTVLNRCLGLGSLRIARTGGVPVGRETDSTRRKWRKSSYSDAANGCLEVAEARGRMCVRDSKNTELGFLGFTEDEWSAFLRPVTRR